MIYINCPRLSIHVASCMPPINFTVNKDGGIQAKTTNPAVPDELLWEIHRWRMEDATDVDIITRLRQRTVPTGYCLHTWCPGTILNLTEP